MFPGTPNIPHLPPPSPGTPPPHGQSFPSPAKWASSITPPGTGAFLMLSSIASHNDSLAGVPGCPPLPEGALIYGWEARGSGRVDAGRQCPHRRHLQRGRPSLFPPTHAPTGVFQPSRSTPWGISLIQPSLNYEGPPILTPAS